MLAAGAVEIAAGVLVAIKPHSGRPSLAHGLCLIILNLITVGSYLDVALRDLGLALAAFALGRLSVEFDASRP